MMNSRIWLLPLLLVACDGSGDAGPSSPGAVDVHVNTSGGDIDADGYLIVIDGVQGRTAPPNGLVSITDIGEGRHELELVGVADNCVVVGGTLRHVTVEAHALRLVSFGVECDATGIRVTTSFTGVDQDPVLHILLDNTLRPEVVESDNSREVTRLAPGQYDVRLGDLASNCQVEPASRVVTVTARQVTEARFSGRCVATTGVVLVTVRGSGDDLDQSGYSVATPGVAGVIAPTGETLVLPGVPAGTHPIRLTGVAHNCTVDGPNPQDVAVSTGTETRDTVAAAFNVVCTRRWGLAFARGSRVTLATATADIVESTVVGGRPAWSPDGRRLAFSCGGLCVMDLQGNGVATVPLGDLLVESVAWRPDGRQLIVAIHSCSGWDGYCEFEGIVLVAPEGGGRIAVPVPPHVYWVSGLSWSPDGRTVVFGCSLLPEFQSKICSMQPDGTGFRALTTGTWMDMDPAWSPDGSRIAFASMQYGSLEIMLMNPEGRNLTRLSPGAAGWGPAWSPDGKRLGYSMEAGNQRGLMVVQVDGSGGVRLTTRPDDNGLAWRP